MKTKTRYQVLWQALFILLVTALVYPLLFATSNSMKTDSEAFQTITSLIPASINIDNYLHLFTSLPLLQIIFNTFAISTVVTLVRMIFSFLAAYALVFYGFKGKKLYSSLIYLTLFMPFTAIMIPNYLMLAKVNLVNTIWGVMLPMFFSATGIFMLSQNMRTIPVSLIEVAQLENVPTRKIMKDIVLPLVKPQMIATGIWFFAGTWNEYAWPRFMLKTTENYTLSLALQMFTSGEGNKGFTSVMAMSVLTMIIPMILYIIFQRYIIETFTSSGIK